MSPILCLCLVMSSPPPPLHDPSLKLSLSVPNLTLISVSELSVTSPPGHAQEAALTEKLSNELICKGVKKAVVD